MKKSIKVTPKKRRGRPATGRDPHVTSRMPGALITDVETWASANGTTRSEAIRRLVEIGLSVGKPRGQTSNRTSAEIKHLAGQAIDEMADPKASIDEKASQKRRLMSGPEEFRDDRVDLQKAKK